MADRRSAAAMNAAVPTRVLHLISALKIGGIGFWLLRNLRAMRSPRYEHLVCSLSEPRALRAEYEQAGFAPLQLGYRNRLTAPRTLARLVATIRGNDVSLVHTNLRLDGQYGALAGMLSHTPVVSTLHNDNPPLGSRTARWIERRVEPSIARYIAVSDLTKQVNVERRGLDPSKVTVVHSGIPAAEFASPSPPALLDRLRADLGLAADDPVLLNVGRLHEQKGQKQLVPMMAIIRKSRPDAKLLIAGEGEQRDELERLIREYGVQDEVRLLGLRNDIKQLLEIASVFVFPSLWEAFGLAALEAMAVGVPVVASRIGGIPEVIEDGVSGILVPPADPEALAVAVLRVLGDRTVAEGLAGSARERVAARFDIGVSAQRILRVYDEVLGF